MYNWFIVTDDLRMYESTEGSEEKFFIKYEGVKYLVKDSSYNKKRKQSSLAPFCEYVGSHFINSINVPCQKTYLGLYRGRVVVICKDLFEGTFFRPFEELHQSSVDSLLSNKEYTYNDVLYVMSKMINLNNYDNALKSFWRMFICDAILGNRDRHGGNWGFVWKGSGFDFSPIFDNGSSLFPDADLSRRREKLYVKMGTFKVPGSQFKRYRSDQNRYMRTNYWQELQNSESDVAFQAVLPEFLNLDILSIIRDILECVPGECAYWFAMIIYCRYMCLIKKRDFDEVFKEVEYDKYGEDWLSDC